ADLDPVARGEIMAALMTEAAERGTSIVLSSHVLSELEQTCDWVLVLRDGRIELSEDVDELRESHAVVTGHADQDDTLTEPHTVVRRSASGRQLTALIRQRGPLRGDWHVERPKLEDILSGYLQAGDTVRPADAERTEAAA
ncbi:ABC transporter ATP-binding protein, partial [Streptomyces sp. NPDC054940]